MTRNASVIDRLEYFIVEIDTQSCFCAFYLCQWLFIWLQLLLATEYTVCLAIYVPSLLSFRISSSSAFSYLGSTLSLESCCCFFPWVASIVDAYYMDVVSCKAVQECLVSLIFHFRTRHLVPSYVLVELCWALCAYSLTLYAFFTPFYLH